MDKYFLECRCEAPDHTLRVCVNKEFEALSFEYHLPAEGFRQRLKRAWSYLWGRQSCVADVLLNDEAIANLKQAIEAYEHEEQEK